MNFGRALKRISREFMRNANRMFEQHGLTAAQAEMLFYLVRREAQGLSTIQRDIEGALSLSNPTVSGTIDRLAKKGFVERRPCPDNRRVNNIALTGDAWALHEEAHRSFRELEERILAPLSDDERSALMSILEKMLASLSES